MYCTVLSGHRFRRWVLPRARLPGCRATAGGQRAGLLLVGCRATAGGHVPGYCWWATCRATTGGQRGFVLRGDLGVSALMLRQGPDVPGGGEADGAELWEPVPEWTVYGKRGKQRKVGAGFLPKAMGRIWQTGGAG